METKRTTSKKQVNKPTEAARNHIRSRLNQKFADFMEGATEEEIWLLVDVLDTWQCIRGPEEYMALVEAFDDAIGRPVAAFTGVGGRA